MLTTERISKLQDAVLESNQLELEKLPSLSREEQDIVNGLQNEIIKYAAGLNKLINEHK